MPREAYLLFVGLFLSVASNNLLTPLLSAIRTDMGLSLASIGVFVSTYGFARLCIDVPSGLLASKVGARTVAVAGVSLNAVFSTVGALAPGFGVLIVARIGAGLGAGLISTVVLSALSEVAPPAIRGRAMSFYQVANNLGIALYPLIGGVIGSLLSWRAAFVMAAVCAVLSGLTLAPVLERIGAMSLKRRTSRPAAAGPPRSRSRWGRLLFLAPFAAVYFGVVANMINRHGFRNTVLPLYASSRLHLGEVQTATGITLMSLVGISVAIPGAALGDRIGRKRIVVAGLTLLAVGDFLFPTLATGFTSFLLASMLVGAGDFFSSSQTALLSDMVEGPRRSTALGLYRFFVDLGALAGPSMLAVVMSAHGPDVAITTAGCVLLAGAAVGLVGIPARPERPNVTRPARVLAR